MARPIPHRNYSGRKLGEIDQATLTKIVKGKGVSGAAKALAAAKATIDSLVSGGLGMRHTVARIEVALAKWREEHERRSAR